MHFTEAIKELIYGQTEDETADGSPSNASRRCPECGARVGDEVDGDGRSTTCPACGSDVRLDRVAEPNGQSE